MCAFLQLEGKRYPLKAVRILKKRRKKSPQTDPTGEHKALSGTVSTLCVRCKSILLEAPEKGP